MLLNNYYTYPYREKDKTNPELQNWIQNLDLVEPEEEEEDSDEDTVSNTGEDMDTGGDMDVSDPNMSEIKCEAIVENVVVSEPVNDGEKVLGDSSQTDDSTASEEGKSAGESSRVDSETGSGAQLDKSSSDRDDNKDTSLIKEDDNSDTLSADSIRYESETGGDDTRSGFLSMGPFGDNNKNPGERTVSDKVSVVMENPFKDCERNLLEHILRVQTEIENRLDAVEEQVSGEKKILHLSQFILLVVIVCRKKYKYVQISLGVVV